MAGIVAMLFGAGINTKTSAFSGSNYMFSKLSNHGADERKRHNEAIYEKLQKDRNSWVKERQQRLDFINQQLQRERHAEHTFSEVDDAMDAYYIATEKKLPPLRSKPVLSDFYHPSDQQKNNEILFIISSLGLMGYLMYKSK